MSARAVALLARCVSASVSVSVCLCPLLSFTLSNPSPNLKVFVIVQTPYVHQVALLTAGSLVLYQVPFYLCLCQRPKAFDTSD